MPYTIRKMPGKRCYRVRNKSTKRILSKCTSKANAKKQVRLLYLIDSGGVPRSRRRKRT